MFARASALAIDPSRIRTRISSRLSWFFVCFTLMSGLPINWFWQNNRCVRSYTDVGHTPLYEVIQHI